MSMITFPIARPSATWRSAASGVRQFVGRADMRRHRTGCQQPAQFCLVAGELIGRHVLELKSQHTESP